MPNETYKQNDRIKVYITKVEKTTKGPQVMVSRTHPGLLKRLFELEVPEIYDGTVEIKCDRTRSWRSFKNCCLCGKPGSRSSRSCVGQKGQRVQAIVNELKVKKLILFNGLKIRLNM